MLSLQIFAGHKMALLPFEMLKTLIYSFLLEIFAITLIYFFQRDNEVPVVTSHLN
jgi:hypothetical protein